MRALLGAPVLALSLFSLATFSAARARADAYVLTGDLGDIEKKGQIRFLVPSTPDYLRRDHDPRNAERQLAEDFAAKVGLKAQFIPVSGHDQLLAELNAGHGDVVVASMTITKERAERAAFTRPIRYVKEVVIVKETDNAIKALEDLANKEVTVRPSSAYATTLKELSAKVPGLKIKAAPETEDTLDLIQKVARGEEKITVADADIFEAAKTFESGFKRAFDLTDKDPIAWGLRKSSAALKAALDSFLIERALTSHTKEVYKADLDEIKKRRVLRVLTRNASNCFFIYRGEELGFEYELAQDFAKELGVRLEIVVPPSREALFSYLEEGRGDMIGAALAITPERERTVDFAGPYLKVSELVVVPTADKKTKTLDNLRGKKISVRKSSSYYETLSKLKDKYGFQIDLLPEDMETEDALRHVAEGKVLATVADSNIVEIELTYTDAIRSIGPLGEPVDLGWVVRKDQPNLKAATNAFLKKIYHGVFYNMTVKKYFKDGKTMRAAAGNDRVDKEGHISPYDDIAKKWSRQFEFDWRLIASQMYQESHFDPKAKSWVGAQGLLQVMPKTAQELKIANVEEPDAGVHAGVMLLARYAKMFEDPAIKDKDKIRFALAAYNCGPGHIHDARRLAKDLNLDQNRWFQNVEKAMSMLSDHKIAKKARYGYCRCSEPVKYVSEIQTRYDAYSKLVPLE
jgi:peptidoglycan lytic transglycosylase F